MPCRAPRGSFRSHAPAGSCSPTGRNRSARRGSGYRRPDSPPRTPPDRAVCLPSSADVSQRPTGWMSAHPCLQSRASRPARSMSRFGCPCRCRTAPQPSRLRGEITRCSRGRDEPASRTRRRSPPWHRRHGRSTGSAAGVDPGIRVPVAQAANPAFEGGTFDAFDHAMILICSSQTIKSDIVRRGRWNTTLRAGEGAPPRRDGGPIGGRPGAASIR